jgi:hypothetical protein
MPSRTRSRSATPSVRAGRAEGRPRSGALRASRSTKGVVRYKRCGRIHVIRATAVYQHVFSGGAGSPAHRSKPATSTAPSRVQAREASRRTYARRNAHTSVPASNGEGWRAQPTARTHGFCAFRRYGFASDVESAGFDRAPSFDLGVTKRGRHGT